MKKKYHQVLTIKEMANEFDGYYVYFHKKDNEIIYVGKGCRQRAISSDKRQYNISRDNITVEIIARFDNSQEANAYEQKMINLHKPKYNKYGIKHKKTQDEENQIAFEKMFKFMI